MDTHADPNDAVRAIESGDVDTLKALLEREPSLAAARTAEGVSLVLHARYRSQHEALTLLLAADPPLDVFDAAALGRAERLIELLDADPGALRSFAADGYQALHLACFFRQPEAAALLIERGAPVDAVSRNEAGVMPLHSAAASKSVAIAERLIAGGAPVNARQRPGWTALMSAAHGGSGELVDLLLAAGADAGLFVDGKTAADRAHEAGHAQLAGKLRG